MYKVLYQWQCISIRYCEEVEIYLQIALEVEAINETMGLKQSGSNEEKSTNIMKTHVESSIFKYPYRNRTSPLLCDML